MMKRFAIALFGMVIVNMAVAQEPCAIQLKEAQKMYEDGVIEKVPSKLSSCLDKGFNRQQKVEALKLMVLCALYEGNGELANERMITFLKYDPEYEIDTEVDPKEFVELMDNFRTSALWTVGLHGGVNLTRIHVLQTFGVQDLSSYNGKYSAPELGLQVSFEVSRFITNRLDVRTGVSIMQKKFQYNANYVDVNNILIDEEQNFINIPLLFNYDITRTNFRPFVMLGGAIGTMTRASGGYTRSYGEPVSRADATGPDIDLSPYRNQWNYWAVGGLGVKYKIPRGFIYGRAFFHYGLNNMAITNNRYSDPERLFKYYHVEHDFIQDNMVFEVGYSYSFYKPKAKKIK